uniref:RNase H type-1 domain-containing protein n=2 Tax=Brassica oleracea TaxID=3712 RepID=A0A0D3AEZ6_BRAOL|nr:unnamed protein product [Brassica oleracea]
MGPATRETSMMVVRDLIQEDTGKWNRNLIQAILPFEEERILQLQPSSRGAPDILRWLGTKTDEYSVKTGYHVETVVRSDAVWSEQNWNAGLSWVMTTAGEKSIGQRETSFVSSVLVAESLALRDAVLANRRLGVKEVQFEADSAQLIMAITSKMPPMEIYGIVEDITRLSVDFEFVVFGWIPRLRNVEADCIAKQALSMFEQEVVGVLLPPPN